LGAVRTREHRNRGHGRAVARDEQLRSELTNRTTLVSAASAAQALDQAEALLIETVDLAEKRTGIDLAEFREILSERREALDPPGF
jgi:hypothetical protein